MLNINCKKWVLIFLFYGSVCFTLGFLGSLGHGDMAFVSKKPTSAKINHPDLVVQSEKYLTGLLADLIIRDREDAVIPAFGTISPMPFFFCHPEKTEEPSLKSLIQKISIHFKERFSDVDIVPIAANSNWERSIAHILEEEPQGVVMGMNLTGLSQETPRVNIHIYFCAPENLPQVFLKKYSKRLNTFLLSKQSLKNRDLYILTWEDIRGEYINNLELCFNDLLELIEAQVARRQKSV